MGSNVPRGGRCVTHAGDETGMQNLNEAFVLIAEKIETEIAALGWDQPSSLWVVEDIEVPDSIRAEHSDCFALAYSTRLAQVLDGHPADAMLGLRIQGAVGVVLVTEGWSYSSDRLAELAAGVELPAPAECADRVEIRLAHLVMRDGTEAVVMRKRSEAPEVLHGLELTGRVVVALRRVLGVPSRVLHGMFPEFCTVRRLVLAGFVDAAIESAKLLGEDPMPLMRVFAAGVAAESPRVRAPLARLGLYEPDWSAALQRALTSAEEEGETHFLEWADEEMYAEYLLDRFGPIEPRLAKLRALGGAGKRLALAIETFSP
jgi:hypothetical protein